KHDRPKQPARDARSSVRSRGTIERVAEHLFRLGADDFHGANVGGGQTLKAGIPQYGCLLVDGAVGGWVLEAALEGGQIEAESLGPSQDRRVVQVFRRDEQVGHLFFLALMRGAHGSAGLWPRALMAWQRHVQAHEVELARIVVDDRFELAVQTPS